METGPKGLIIHDSLDQCPVPINADQNHGMAIPSCTKCPGYANEVLKTFD